MAEGGRDHDLPQTRSSSSIWLIGPVSETITGMKLPTNRQVLSVFFYHHTLQKQTIRDSSRFAVRAAFDFWKMANIPTTIERNAIEKLEKMVNIWQKLKKNASRTSHTQQLNENTFEDHMDKLFDVAHAEALKMIKIAEDCEFLEDQRGPRIGYMSQVDKTLSEKEERKVKRRERQENLMRVEQQRKEIQTRTATDEKFMTEDELCGESEDEQESSVADKSPPMKVQKRTRLQNIVTSDLASALDRVNISDRNATFVLAAAAESLGHDISALSISRSSIRAARIKNRSQLGRQSRDSFFVSDVPLTIHWDGKMLPDIVGRDTVDRLAVLVSGLQVDKLLGVPKIGSGTGEAVSDAVLKTAEDWGIKGQIRALSFDTTASNTGRRAGACSLIEAKLGRDLLYLSCRHHIHEIVLSDVFKYCLGPSSGPEIGLFKRFRDIWTSVDKNNYRTGADDKECLEVFSRMQQTKLESIQYAVNLLQSTKQPRDDYRELAELTVIFLGAVPPRGVRFMAPGAVHRARWMAKLIYAMKVWMFRDQFRLTLREEKALRDICLFGSLIYVKAWMSCSCSLSAPANDLTFLKALHSYRTINKGVSSTAVAAFQRHLWYIREQLVALAFFDNDVDNDLKRHMVAALKNPGSEDQPKRIQIDTAVIESKQLPDFVTSQTLSFFDILGLQHDFLWHIDPQKWAETEEFVQARLFASNLKVVNDTAERAVKLAQDFNNSITKNEEQKQYLLQVVSDHRSQFPEAKKCLLACQESETLDSPKSDK